MSKTKQKNRKPCESWVKQSSVKRWWEYKRDQTQILQEWQVALQLFILFIDMKDKWFIFKERQRIPLDQTMCGLCMKS